MSEPPRAPRRCAAMSAHRLPAPRARCPSAVEEPLRPITSHRPAERAGRDARRASGDDDGTRPPPARRPDPGGYRGVRGAPREPTLMWLRFRLVVDGFFGETEGAFGGNREFRINRTPSPT